MTPKDLNDCKASIEKSFIESWELINKNEGWHLSKTTTLACENVDRVEYRISHINRKRRIFRLTATLPTSVDQIASTIRDIDNIANWNKTVQAARVVKELQDDMLISYHITASNGWIVFPRDFVFGVKFDYISGCFVAGGCSLESTKLPPEEDLVRAWNFPGCMVVRPLPGQPGSCLFQWLMECDYGGWIPTALTNISLPFAMVLLVDSLKEKLENDKKAVMRSLGEKK